MSTDSDTPQPPTTVPDATAGARAPDIRPEHPSPHEGQPRPEDEAALRTWEGLPADAVILAPPFATTPPMQLPDQVWAMLVLAVDIVDGTTDPDRAGDVALFAGCWIPDQPPADRHDGDLVLRFAPPATTQPQRWDRHVDIDMLLAYRGHWQQVGHWPAMDTQWPRTIAPTAATIMRLHTDTTEATAPAIGIAPTTDPELHWARGSLTELLTAGLLHVGDELVWQRRHKRVRHTARVRSDGALQLANGSVHPNPTGATTALGGHHQNGWTAWQRMTDDAPWAIYAMNSGRSPDTATPRHQAPARINRLRATSRNTCLQTRP